MSEEVDTEVEWEAEVELDSISITLEMFCESVLPLVVFEVSVSEQVASFLWTSSAASSNSPATTNCWRFSVNSITLWAASTVDCFTRCSVGTPISWAISLAFYSIASSAALFLLTSLVTRSVAASTWSSSSIT